MMGIQLHLEMKSTKVRTGSPECLYITNFKIWGRSKKVQTVIVDGPITRLVKIWFDIKRRTRNLTNIL